MLGQGGRSICEVLEKMPSMCFEGLGPPVDSGHYCILRRMLVVPVNAINRTSVHVIIIISFHSYKKEKKSGARGRRPK